MPALAFALALASALLHAAWNLLLARARETQAATAAALLVGALVFAPVAAATWQVDWAAAPWIAASALLEIAYFALLASAYARGRLGAVYPIARGSAPLLVLVVGAVALGVAPHPLAIAGVCLIGGGVALVRGLGRGAEPQALRLALPIAACVAAYTLVDKAGLRHARPLPYLELVVAPAALASTALVARRRGRAAIAAGLRGAGGLAGPLLFGAFGLALAALRLAPQAAVPAVQAVRETSVLVAVALAWAVLREPVGAARAAGALAVVGGVAALALA